MQEPKQPEVVQPEVLPPPDPGAFTPGAHDPATSALSLKDRLRQSGATTQASGEIRRRGRTRRPKDPDEPKDRLTPEDLNKERSRKSKRADDIAASITDELNPIILKAMISQGLPSVVVYKEGREPVNIPRNSPYTEVGAKLIIDPFAAEMIGAFIAEFESSDLGAQIAAKTTGGPVGLIVKGLVAGACVAGYVQGVREVFKRTEVLRAAVQQYEKNKSKDNVQTEGAHSVGLA